MVPEKRAPSTCGVEQAGQIRFLGLVTEPFSLPTTICRLRHDTVRCDQLSLTSVFIYFLWVFCTCGWSQQSVLECASGTKALDLIDTIVRK